MKKTVIILVLTVVLFLFMFIMFWGGYMYYDKDKNCFINKAETAIEIAQSIILDKYPDASFENEVFDVLENETKWEILVYTDPSLYPGHIILGGGWYIELCNTGCVTQGTVLCVDSLAPVPHPSATPTPSRFGSVTFGL